MMSEYIVSKSQETSGWDIHYGKRFIRNVQRQQIALMFSDELHRERFIISQTENKRIAELEEALKDLVTIGLPEERRKNEDLREHNVNLEWQCQEYYNRQMLDELEIAELKAANKILHDHIGIDKTTAHVKKVLESVDSTTIVCDVCGENKSVSLVWSDNGDIITACKDCQNNDSPLIQNFDDEGNMPH